MFKTGHTFPAKHGFSGSAGKNMRPSIPGYKFGGMEHDKGHVEHADGAKDHYGKKGNVDHDGTHSMSKVKYDKDGFQEHCHGGMTK